MGIFGLQTFLDEKQWYDVVNIRDIADEFKRSNSVVPVIAVDASSCARHIYGQADNVCGGQYKQFRERCREFVQKFLDNGIRLSFFFDGLPVEEKVGTWIDRRLPKLKQISTSFEELRTGHYPKIFYLTPEAVVPSARVIFRAELDCEVHVATGDCDWELAEYARRDDCLGVMSNDTDLLAHEGVPCLFVLRHLEMNGELKVRRYNPADIASKLELKLEHLPVFATFVGNDIIRSGRLISLKEQLWSRYGGGNPHENVAKFVREGPPEDLTALCAYAFEYSLNNLESEVRASVNSYRHRTAVAEEPMGDGAWGEVLRLAEERHVTCQMPAVVYAVMKRGLFRIGEVLEDLADQRGDSPPTGLVLRQMRTRLYAVLLRERSPDSAEVREVLPTGIDSITDEMVPAAQLPSSVLHPGLRALWQQQDGVVDDQRWRLFGWVTSPRADLSKLRALSPPHLVVPAVALSYLRHGCHPPLLSEEEAAVFAAVAVVVADAPASLLAGPKLESVNARAVYLATLFVRTVLHVLDAAAACGLSFPCEKDCLPDAYFDGRYFHDVYAFNMFQSHRSRFPRDPSRNLQWRPTYQAQFQQLVDAIESVGAPMGGGIGSSNLPEPRVPPAPPEQGRGRRIRSRCRRPRRRPGARERQRWRHLLGDALRADGPTRALLEGYLDGLYLHDVYVSRMFQLH